ncbi:hypothetical protein FQA39_LY12692 [Lamprigera yunnana]|nr:hypothetical protein FQA39_LY12692 [Lamprigera yunnana]
MLSVSEKLNFLQNVIQDDLSILIFKRTVNLNGYLVLNFIENIEYAEDKQLTFYNPEDPFYFSDSKFIKLFILKIRSPEA